MKRIADNFLIFLLILGLTVSPVRQMTAQTGVLIPSSRTDKPDPKILSLAVMNVDITIDNQHATVKVMQIFDNHTTDTLEGKYLSRCRKIFGRRFRRVVPDLRIRRDAEKSAAP